MKKRLNINVVLQSLARKGVKIVNNRINLAGARDLGNKSWGHIDYLVCDCGYIVENRSEYIIRMYKERKVHADSIVRKASIQIPKPTSVKIHPFLEISKHTSINGRRMNTSEFEQLLIINELQDRYKRDVLKHTSKEVKDLKERKKLCNGSFENRLVVHFNVDSEAPTILLNNKQPSTLVKKLRRL